MHAIRILRKLHWCTDQNMSAALARLDLTASQGCVMGFLAHRQTPPCARDVEDFLELSHPSVAGILSRLEKKNFIEFRADPQDGRCKRIFLLPKGRECIDAMEHEIRDIENRMVDGFTDAEVQQFHAFLDRAINNMGGTPCKRKEE